MKTFDSFLMGDHASMSKVISDADITQFAELTGDSNPIHLDEEVAKHSFFGKRVAHGMLSAGIISAVLGTKLPGPGGIYLSHNIRFKKPVFIGDEITAHVEISSLDKEKQRITLSTYCTNQKEECVLDGEALLFYPTSKN